MASKLFICLASIIIIIAVNFGRSDAAVAQNQTSAAPTAAKPLTAGDNVALLLINSFRLTHQAPPVTYSADLRDLATTCADLFVAYNPNPTTPLLRPYCPFTTAGTTIGYNNGKTTNGIRAVISDPTGGWFSQYVNNQLLFPPNANASFNTATQDYTQMIWVGSKQVGCAFSSNPVNLNDNVNPVSQQNILICLFSPAGNIPAQFPANVLADI